MLLLSKFKEFWFKPTDPRVYALIRIGYAISALLHIAIFWPVRQQFFSTSGMIDHYIERETRGMDVFFLLFPRMGSELEVTLIFIAATLVLISLGLGFFSRSCAFLAFIWSCSYSTAIFPAYAAHDDMLRIYATYLMISPIGQTWSLDSWLKGGKGVNAAKLTPRYGLMLMRWQLSIIYVSTVIYKLKDPFWRAGTVLPYFLMSSYSRVSDYNFAPFEAQLRFFTYMALFTEIVVPVILWFRKTRLIGFILGWGLHGVIGVTTSLPDFSFLMIISYLAFLEREDIEWVGKKWRAWCNSRLLIWLSR